MTAAAGGLYGLLQPVGIAVDPIFSPLTALPPYITIFVMAVILTSLIILISRIFVNRKVMLAMKEQMEEIKERMNRAQKEGNKEEQNKHLSELMKVNSGYMRHTMKIMVVSIVIVMIFFPWLSYRYTGLTAVNLPFTIPYLNWSTLEWFYWYVIAAFAVGNVMRKIMGSEI